MWSDWASQPKAELAAGIRLDTNYYYWPGSWLANRPGFMTGSGFPMRFTDTDGTLIDVFQATTQMTDESGQSYPFTPDTLLDRALGAQGYYGAFTANLHTDNQTTFEDTQVLASAQARGVPVISAKQLLTWVDGRNALVVLRHLVQRRARSPSPSTSAPAPTSSPAMLPTSGPGGRTLDVGQPRRDGRADHADDRQGSAVRHVRRSGRRPHRDVRRRRLARHRAGPDHGRLGGQRRP